MRRPLSSLALALSALGAAVPAGSTASGPETPRESLARLVIERIDLTGNTRTETSIALLAAGLASGDPATSEAILVAADRLRESGLFRQVTVHTRPGSGPGRIVVVFAVQERRPHLRLGMGYEDLSGWYLIPVQLNMDNLTGHGETLNLSTRLGYRVSGIVLTLRRSRPGDPLSFWEARLRGEGQDRVYFLDETEIRHPVSRGGADLRVGHALAKRAGLETWLGFETVEADSAAEVYRDRPERDRHKGDEIPFELLPAEIRIGIGRRSQSRAGLALTLDTRRGAGLQSRGLWGRTGGEVVLSSTARFVSWQWDLRAYAPLADGILLAARTRAGAASADAPFHERFYLGGLYTVRGYPSQSLSPPGGHLRYATASVELRTAWIGTGAQPRLVGLVFLDLGSGWNHGAPDLRGGAAGAGYGFRLRLPWIGRLGVDIGIPLSASPVEEAFRVNLSLGWTF